jgi:diketogulonate reductase-like aldo/keto reductase
VLGLCRAFRVLAFGMAFDPRIEVRGVSLPWFFYGTAWKEERTQELTTLALSAGFRAIDTANQRRHYHEAAVGEAVKAFIAGGGCTREQLFLQSKFTYQSGQDHRLPYDPRAPLRTQVEQSFASTLEHFGTTYLDAFLLHGPSIRQGLTTYDFEVWGAMESLAKSEKVRLIGISNASVEQLTMLQQRARIKPAFVQNRCYARSGWDRDVRAFAAKSGIAYQGFSLLTGNPREVNGPLLQEIAEAHGKTVSQVVFRFARAVGMIPLTGTSDLEHMRQDLAAGDFELEADEIAQIEGIAQ